MDTPEEAKQKVRDMVEKDRAKAERERLRTYTERLQDMGRLPKPSGGAGGSGDLEKDMMGGKFKPLNKAKGGKISSASKRADGCAQRGKTKGRMT
jgi:hypothetical protein